MECSHVVVLDLETLWSADDCRHCGHPEDAHMISTLAGGNYCPPGQMRTGYERLGWDAKAALGLSVGCYWSYADSRIYWFDMHTLQATMQAFIDQQLLMVSFNGIGFDFPLMRALLYDCADKASTEDDRQPLLRLCADFTVLCASSYDLLAEIWKQDPDDKYARSNSLDAISQASGLGAKLSHGAQAPRDWQARRYANVLNYCQDDVYKTKSLFEMICRGEPIIRGNGLALLLPTPEPSLCIRC